MNMSRVSVRLAAPIVAALLCCGSAAIAWDGLVVRVIDGDTIDVARDAATVRVRIYGIDCPDGTQPGAKAAAEHTTRLIGAAMARVDEVGRASRGRVVARVSVGGVDVGAALVRSGMAWWYREYAPGDDVLRDAEAAARAEGAGLWASDGPIPPWKWRRGAR